MCPASPRESSACPDRKRAPGAGPIAPGPSFILDVGAGLLLDATPAGWALLGLDAGASPPPVALDAAMPALARLRQLAAAGGRASEGEVLVLWTVRGAQRITCRVEECRVPGVGAATLVSVRDGEPDAGRPALGAWLAHELRTPLGAVIACAEVLQSQHFGPLGDARYLEYSRGILESARHALGVVDSLLCGEAVGGVPAHAATGLDPTAVIEACLAVARPLADRAGVELSAACPGDLPRLQADELALRQMLLNLLGNAIKFARPGDRVQVAVSSEGGALAISVSDTGPGLPSAAAQKAANGSARPKGMGLGLPMTRALAAANGATLAVTSAPGEGTCATIAFAADRVLPPTINRGP